MKNSKITKLKAQRSKEHKLISQKRHDESIKAIASLEERFKELYTLINDKDTPDYSELSEQIAQLHEVLDLKPQLEAMVESVKAIKPNINVEKPDLSAIIKAIKENKTEIDLSRFEKAIIEVTQRVQDLSEPDSQDPEDYKPFRRVILVGNRLMYDDRPTGSGGRGGGGGTSGSTSVSNFPDDYPLPAAQLTTLTPPAAITGFATSANQSSILTELYVTNGAMAMRVDDTTGTIYQGWAEPGTATSAASWRVRRIVTSDTPEDTTITFADGNRSFDNVWDNRASLSYS